MINILSKRYKKIKQKLARDIYNYIQSRYEYYDELEGKSCAEKYTDAIFKETSKKYDMSEEEISKLYYAGSTSFSMTKKKLDKIREKKRKIKNRG